MSDLRDLTSLLDRFGVEYYDRPHAGVGYDHPERAIVIETDGPRNVGYVGFVAEFYFDDDERFVKVGVWE
jgi:hypothetical protein